MYELNATKNTSFDDITFEGLVDIKDVAVDKNLSKADRITEYIRQIKNPHCFKCGKFVVKARFADNGVSLEDCLRSILA